MKPDRNDVFTWRRSCGCTQFSCEGIGYVLSGDGDDHNSMETVVNLGLIILY